MAHKFDMGAWGKDHTCGTVACLWGTAYLMATGELASDGPSREWVGQFDDGEIWRRLFYMSELSFVHVQILGDSIRDGRFNLAGAKLTGANLEDANLGGANLRGADLTGADLGGANLRDCLCTSKLTSSTSAPPH